jgi:hypothetical protein
MLQRTETGRKPRATHSWPREPNGHYVDLPWCSRRLFDVERFDPLVLDPCCGWCRIPESAIAAGYRAIGSDIIDRRADANAVRGIEFHVADFLRDPPVVPSPFSIVGNPPFNQLEDFVERALTLKVRKFAFIWRLQRLASAHWLQETPLARVYLLSPRPSMPPGSYIEAGGYVGGDSHDYCWVVFEHGYVGRPEIYWLRRDPMSDARSDNIQRELVALKGYVP